MTSTVRTSVRRLFVLADALWIDDPEVARHVGDGQRLDEPTDDLIQVITTRPITHAEHDDACGIDGGKRTGLAKSRSRETVFAPHVRPQ